MIIFATDIPAGIGLLSLLECRQGNHLDAGHAQILVATEEHRRSQTVAPTPWQIDAALGAYPQWGESFE
jgi:hypothetical protein